jgi:hypothetical protein
MKPCHHCKSTENVHYFGVVTGLTEDLKPIWRTKPTCLACMSGKDGYPPLDTSDLGVLLRRFRPPQLEEKKGDE